MVFCYSSKGLNRSTCFLIGSIVFLVLNVTFYFGIDLIVSSIIYSKLTLLQSDSELFSKWVRLPIPLGLKVWVFETTNPDEIWTGKKPILREKGPYVFSLWREKKILEIKHDTETIKYSEHNVYFFNESQSIGSLEDKIVTLNVPTVAIAEKLGSIGNNLPLRGLTGISLELIGNGLFQAHKEELMANMTIDDLLFKGQKVKILQTLETIWTPLALIGVKFPSTGLKDNTYGLFYGQNSTFAEPLEIIGQGTKLGKVVSWKNQKKLTCWPGETCNTIRGTDGAMFSPFIDKSRVHIFIPDLCRFISFDYDMKIVFRGIAGYRFIISESTFFNKHRYPSNECFCPTNGFPCNTDGVTSIGPCRANAPIYLSKPHFLSASRHFLESIEGLQPNISQHESFIDIEPTTGTPLRAKVQLQVNVYVRRFPFIKTMSDIRKETLYPLVWFEQSAEINEELAQELINKLIKPLSYVKIVKYGSLIVTLTLFIICLIFKCLSTKKIPAIDTVRRKSQSQLRQQNLTIGSMNDTIDQRRRQSLEARKLYNLQKRGSSIKIHEKAKTLKPFILQR